MSSPEVSRRTHAVRCEVCRVESEASIHTVLSGGTMFAWARPPLGWWMMLGSALFRCPSCLRVEEPGRTAAEAS
jgi:hypothetical protein